MSYHGDIALGDSIDIKFTTVNSSGVPTTLAGTPVVSAYVDNGTTEITAGVTLTVDFDAVTGLHNVRVVASGGNGFATGTNVQLVITTGTVDGNSVVGYVVGSFSIEDRPLNAAKLATDAVNEIRDAILSDSTAFAGANIDAAVSSRSSHAAADAAVAVWDALQSAHVTAGSFGELATEIADILADTNELQTDDVPGLIAALNDLSAAEVNAEVLDVLGTDTQSLPAQGAPPATPTLIEVLMHFYEAYRNKLEQTATEFRILADDETTVNRKTTVSDDGTTTTRGEIVTGP